MRSWSPRKILAVWIGWYALILLALMSLPLFIAADSGGAFALPLPSNVYVNGQQVSRAVAFSTFAAIAFLLISLPPLLLTSIWWYQRRGRAS